MVIERCVRSGCIVTQTLLLVCYMHMQELFGLSLQRYVPVGSVAERVKVLFLQQS